MPAFVCLPVRKLVFDLELSVRELPYTGQIQTFRAKITADGDVGGRLAVCCALLTSVPVENGLKSLTQSEFF